MNNAYRHVCFKDLENYFSRNDYFSNLTYEEIKLIRQNLGVASVQELEERQGGIVYKTYDELNQIVSENGLVLTCKYILTDFQTIYLSNSGEVWGYDINPSEVYSLILTPISVNKFDTRVSVVKNEQALDWIVNYNFTQETLVDNSGKEFKTKGKITYLKDQNNNSAYYDFKNIRFKLLLNNSEVQGLQQDTYLDLFTFSKLEDNNEVKENSNDVSIMNNQFDCDCYLNVFLGTTNNNHFYGGFKNNLFVKDCTFNKFEWNTTGNKFTESVMYTQGSLKNAKVNTTAYDSAVSKEFRMLHSQTSAEPVFVVTYLDGDTLTNQVYKLTKI